MVARDQIRDHELAGLRSGTPGEPHQLERARLVAGGLGGLPYIGQVRKSTSLIGGAGGILLYRPCRRAALLRPVIHLAYILQGVVYRVAKPRPACALLIPLRAHESGAVHQPLQLVGILRVELQDAEEGKVSGRGVSTVPGHVPVVKEVDELRSVLRSAALLDDHLVRRRRRRCRLRASVAVGLGLLLVWCVHPAGELVDEVLVGASAGHRTSPVTVKKRSREYISISPTTSSPM